ncbi:MAG TPA: hypothetical protein CFH84_11280 [Sulfurimonas sp. UBA12504]|nr:MAG TPA: hypothetical protein CFH84_11280 [Sulfurimonas sp. UBA12504]
MKLLTLATLLSASLLIFSGCAGTPLAQKEIPIDASLPQVELTDNGMVADMNAIAFEWKSIRDPRVEGVYVYRIDAGAQDTSDSVMQYYDKIESRYVTHYTDQNVVPNSNYKYYFRTYSKGSQSTQGRLIGVKSLDIFDSVSWLYSVTDMPRSAKIIWRPHANGKVEHYRIERKAANEDDFEEIGRVQGRLSVEFIDTELKDNHIYMYRIFAVTYDGIISKPSEIVKVVTKPLPEGVTNIQATKNLPKSIKVTWSESNARDFYKFNVYRSDNADGQYTLIASLLNTVHVDKLEEDGKNYFYRISVLDKDGLESINDDYTVQGSSLDKPVAPIIVSSGYRNNGIELTWSNLDTRIKNYVVTRDERVGWVEELHEEFKGLKTQTFLDSNLKPNTTYIYKVYGVDQYNILTQASTPVTIVTSENVKANSSQRKVMQQEIQSTPMQDVKVQDEDTIIPADNLDLSEI